MHAPAIAPQSSLASISVQQDNRTFKVLLSIVLSESYGLVQL